MSLCATTTWTLAGQVQKLLVELGAPNPVQTTIPGPPGGGSTSPGHRHRRGRAGGPTRVSPRESTRRSGALVAEVLIGTGLAGRVDDVEHRAAPDDGTSAGGGTGVGGALEQLGTVELVSHPVGELVEPETTGDGQYR